MDGQPLFCLVDAPAQVCLTLVDSLGICCIPHLLAQLLQFLRNLVGGAASVVQDLLGLPSGLFHCLIPFLLDLLMECLALVADFLGLLAQPLGLLPGRLHLLPLDLQLAEDILKVLIALAHHVPCLFDDILGQTQLPGDGKGVGLPGNANEQAICGPQGLHIKFAGGVDDPLGSHGIELQLRVMGGRHHPAAHGPAKLNNGHGQSGALRRIRTGSQLIKENEGAAVALPGDIHNGPHVGREGGQGLLDGLLIANVRQNPIKGGQAAAISGGNVKAALRHQRQKANGLEGHRLAASIGACDDHTVKVRAQT